MLRHLFDSVAHVQDFNLQTADDVTIWDFARLNSYVLVSKDSDFHQRSFVYGHPPKVIWIKAGNKSTEQIAAVVEAYVPPLRSFESDPEASFIVIS